MEYRARCDAPEAGRLPGTDARLLEQIRTGDAEAGRRFVGEHYPAIYRYLLYLTGRPEQAEDLTQAGEARFGGSGSERQRRGPGPGFLQAWRHFATFEGRASLRAWLHGIARREFLQALRRQRSEVELSESAEVAAPGATAWMGVVELRGVIDRLPLEEREVVLLHYLEGYTSAEIAPIVGAPARTVRRRLAQAREHLRQELGEDDLTYLNEPLALMRQWAWLPLDQMRALETRLAIGSEAREDNMERREFLRHAAVGAAGLVLSESGQEVVDGRLTQKVTLAFKGTALSDVCTHLREKTGVQVGAGSSVADEKVTLFCEKTPLREVMRQLSRPFGYAWTRSGQTGEYRYELLQDLRSQLLEAELRNRDRNAALLALEREIERYRPYLALSPDEALARSKTAPPAEKKLLEQLAGCGWGPVQMYFRLSAAEQVSLRAGQTLGFTEAEEAGKKPLPPELARGVLQAFRDRRLFKRDGTFSQTTVGRPDAPPDALPLTAVPEVQARVHLTLRESEPGQFTLEGDSGYSARLGPKRLGLDQHVGTGPIAVGRCPAVLQRAFRSADRQPDRDPAFRRSVTVEPRAPQWHDPSGSGPGANPGVRRHTWPSTSQPRVTTADVLEALHAATGMSLVADHYTRLYKPGDASIRDLPLSAALDRLAEPMRLRWDRDAEGGWLRFRSAGYYDDRLKEVPNRLLSRWVASRRRHGMLTLDDLVEIAGLSDAQLDGAEMAEGARELFGLVEWDLARARSRRLHLRYLARFTPDQRQEAMSPRGLLFTRMPLAQQQQFLSFALGPNAAPLQSLEELAAATLRVVYTQPGEFEWRQPGPGWMRWVVPVAAGRRAPRPPVRARTRAAALEAAQRIYAPLREGLLRAARRLYPELEEAQFAPQPSQIVPSELNLTIVYMPGSSHARDIRVVLAGGVDTLTTREGSIVPPD